MSLFYILQLCTHQNVYLCLGMNENQLAEVVLTCVLPPHRKCDVCYVVFYILVLTKLHHLSLLRCFFTQVGRSRLCMALKNFAWRSFWTLPGSFSRSLNGPDSRIISNRISVASLSSQSEKWWTKSRLDLDNATSTVDHARRHFQTCSASLKRDDLSRGQMVASMPKLDEGTLGEHLVDVTYDE